MLRNQEFDAAEVSLASYIIAKSRGAPFTAIPVFPRRLFSQNHIFVAENSGITSPAQLAGKRVIIWAFQVTMSVLAKGDMQRDHGLNWRSVEWLTLAPEEIDVPGVPITRLEARIDPIDALIEGRAEAYINPHPPEKAMSRSHGIRRLFEDPAAQCERHFARYGFYPIMHLIAIKNATVNAVPDIPTVLFDLWEDAKAIATDFYHDPGYGLPALLRLGYERQQETQGSDIWPSGLKANRGNLEQFMENMVDQKLIAKPLPLEQLFHESMRDS
jgi:4,5-dihydroxyphthalate decarboxylase